MEPSVIVSIIVNPYFFSVGLLAFVPSLVLSAPEPSRPVDASKLDVAGVRVGMDKIQALDALSKNLGVPRDAIKVDTVPNPFGPKGSSYAHQLNVAVISGRVNVVFVPRLPFDRLHPEVASFVSYSVAYTPATEAAFRKSLVTKYGPPTTGMDVDFPAWCLRLDPRNPRDCALTGQATLRLGSNIVRLMDPTYQDQLTKVMFRGLGPTFAPDARGSIPGLDPRSQRRPP